MSSSRPSDHFDSPEPDRSVVQPKLGFVGTVRFFWRQLTSMRTALFLLLLLAFAAIPGSIVPQRSSDPNGVILYFRDNPDVAPVLDKLQVFDTYTSAWFSAIYLLLFISLIGCIIPRTRHHWNALRTRPPKTPARLERLPGFTSITAPVDAAAALDAGASLLRRQGYRVERYGSSISAERGYLRETGNLVFHISLVGVLIAVGLGGGFGYSGQRVVVEGQRFVNVLGDYDSFNPGRFFSSDQLSPYRLTLNSFEATYETANQNAIGQPIDFNARVTSTDADGSIAKSDIKVNSPLSIGGTDVYLLGNGYAPVVTVRDPKGKAVWTDATPFLPQDPQLFSVGVIKVPDGLAKQVGITGLFYPTDTVLASGAHASKNPDLKDPLLTLRVFTGDLGLDAGVPRSVYALNTDKLTPIAGGKAKAPAIQLKIGDKADLPGGLGTIELTAVKRFASFDIHHDPSGLWVLGFAALILAGLLTGLFIPRRRVWIKIVETDGADIRLEYAGLARGEDPALDAAVTEIAARHSQRLGLKLT